MDTKKLLTVTEQTVFKSPSFKEFVVSAIKNVHPSAVANRQERVFFETLVGLADKMFNNDRQAIATIIKGAELSRAKLKTVVFQPTAFSPVGGKAIDSACKDCPNFPAEQVIAGIGADFRKVGADKPSSQAIADAFVQTTEKVPEAEVPGWVKAQVTKELPKHPEDCTTVEELKKVVGYGKRPVADIIIELVMGLDNALVEYDQSNVRTGKGVIEEYFRVMIEPKMRS